jgi:hypothetical protein
VDRVTDDATPPTARRAWLVYTALRLVVFVGTAGVLVLLGLNGFPLLLVALLVSSVVSLLVLKPQRTAAVDAALARRERRTAERESARARLDQP